MSIFKKDKKYQTIDITTSLDIVDNSFIYKTAKDINHLCKVLKNQAKNGADIQGCLYVKRNQLLSTGQPILDIVVQNGN